MSDIGLARASGRPEYKRSELRPVHGRLLETPNGDFLFPHPGVVDDPKYAPVVAYFVDESGHVRWLERAHGPKNHAELEARRARREERNARR